MTKHQHPGTLHSWSHRTTPAPLRKTLNDINYVTELALYPQQPPFCRWEN